MWAAHTSHWNAVYDVYLDEYFEPNKARVVIEPFDSTPSKAFLATDSFSAKYHWVIAIWSFVALAFVLRSPRLLVLASLPVYSFAVHFMTLFSDRYYFPVMPAVILMSAAGFYGVFGIAWLWVRRARTEADEDESPDEGHATPGLV